MDFSQDQRGRLVYVRTAVAVTCIRIKSQARIFLLVDLRDFFFRFRVGRTKKNKQKSSENDQLTGHFQSFFFFFFLNL